MKAIVAVDKKWGIGKKNGLLFSLPEDMKYFKEKTLNKVVVMGSNTLKSFPNGKPLKDRVNIVLFPGGEKRDDCIVAD
ncbi:MAG: dihydrofolate reductase, partial [Clostridia bacterium]|nr:dihydrofolate reductase [Clostridia bacterium]